MHRTRQRNDGTRTIEKFTGPSPTPKHLNDDANWTAVMDLKADEAYAGFVRAGTDCSVAPHPRAEGALVEIAGVRFGIPSEQASELARGILAAIEKKQRG